MRSARRTGAAEPTAASAGALARPSLPQRKRSAARARSCRRRLHSPAPSAHDIQPQAAATMGSDLIPEGTQALLFDVDGG